MRLTTVAAVGAAVVALAAAGCGGGSPFGGCQSARLVVEPVRASGPRPDIHLRARLTDGAGKALSGAEIQFLLKRTSDQREQYVDYARAVTAADGVADVDYGESIRAAALVRQRATEVRVVHAYLTTTLGDWEGYCEVKADAPFEYTP